MTPLFNDASWGGIMSTELIKEETKYWCRVSSFTQYCYSNVG